jgi:hypothetical protein
MDPMTMLALGGAISSGLGALFGGSDGQERTGFSGNQSAPRTLEDALNAVKGFGRALEGRRAPSVPSAIVQGGPAPAGHSASTPRCLIARSSRVERPSRWAWVGRRPPGAARHQRG